MLNSCDGLDGEAFTVWRIFKTFDWSAELNFHEFGG